MKKIAENSMYLVIALLAFAQIAIGKHYLLGQSCYLISNIIMFTRGFIIKNPVADKVKDAIFSGLTLALIINFLK